MSARCCGPVHASVPSRFSARHLPVQRLNTALPVSNSTRLFVAFGSDIPVIIILRISSAVSPYPPWPVRQPDARSVRHYPVPLQRLNHSGRYRQTAGPEFARFAAVGFSVPLTSFTSCSVSLLRPLPASGQTPFRQQRSRLLIFIPAGTLRCINTGPHGRSPSTFTTACAASSALLNLLRHFRYNWLH